MSLGESGYLNSCLEIVGATKKFESVIREHPFVSKHLGVLGDPMVSVVAFTSTDVAINIYDVADALSSKGWHLNALQSPPSLHCAFTIPTATAVDKLIADLIVVLEIELEKAEEIKRQGKAIVNTQGDTSALYGIAGSIPDKSIVNRLAEGFLDTLYKA